MRRSLPVRWMGLAALWLLTAALSSFGSSAQASSTGQPLVPVIVRARAQAVPEAPAGSPRPAARARQIETMRAAAGESLAPVRSWLAGRQHGPIVVLWHIRALAVSVPPEMLPELESLPGVESVSPDRTVRAPDLPHPEAPPSAVPEGAEWNLDAVRSPDVWAIGFDGAGAVVASMDGGVDPRHADLAARYRGGPNSWFDPNGEHDVPYDAAGHGTATMGVTLGGDSSGNAIGVAPGARWIAVKIFNDTGVATYSGIHQGFQWLLDPDSNPATDDAPDVVNNSWGLEQAPGECIEEFKADIDALARAGIAVVFSAGNAGPGYGSSVSPANNAGAWSVGAVDMASLPASFSSRGPSPCAGDTVPDFAAPGVAIRTADLTMSGLFPKSYAMVSGTSIASAHAAGALAVLAGAFPAAPASELLDTLALTARDLGDPGPDDVTGRGLIDLFAAFVSLNRTYGDCPDADADGYFEAPACGTETDCNGTDPAVHPGADDVEGDGIDQDCNGYDLTIRVSQAWVFEPEKLLVVAATSGLGDRANLALSGYGPMRWSSLRSAWEIVVSGVSSPPGVVTVTGIEGSKSAQPLISPNRFIHRRRGD